MLAGLMDILWGVASCVMSSVLIQKGLVVSHSVRYVSGFCQKLLMILVMILMNCGIGVYSAWQVDVYQWWSG